MDIVQGGGGRAAYRGRVVGERLQVSDVGVDEPPRALDVHAHVVVGGVGDGDSRTAADRSGEAQPQSASRGRCKPPHQRVTEAFHSHDEDGRGHEGGGVEPSLAVGVLPLPLVHLAAAVLAAAAHAEAGADDGHEDHDQDPDRRADEEAHLVVDPLRVGEEGRRERFYACSMCFISFFISGLCRVRRTCSNSTTFSGCRWGGKQMRRGQIRSTHRGVKGC